jgi:hypothetical protein
MIGAPVHPTELEMSLVRSLFAFSSVLIVSTTAGAQAGPLFGGSQLADAAVSIAAVEQIHGCHRHYAQGMQGWHRHGADCTLRRDLAEAKRRKKL